MYILGYAAGPVLAHRAGFMFDIFKVFAIIYLTGQPEGRCRLPVPAKQFYKL